MPKFESTTEMVKSKEPGLTGVPPMTPLDGSIENPGSKPPAPNDQVYGAVPPLTLKANE